MTSTQAAAWAVAFGMCWLWTMVFGDDAWPPSDPPGVGAEVD